MNELDLEEIESHLYSQVYHSTEENDNQIVDTLSRPEPVMRKPNRYFQPNLKNGGPRFQNRHMYHNLKSPTESHQQEGIYSKNYARPQTRDISINQVVVLSASQQPPIVCVTGKKKVKSTRNRYRLKNKRMRQKMRRRQELAEQLLSSGRNNKGGEKTKEQVSCDVITLSDSEEETCEELPNNWPVVSVSESSDDKINNEESANLTDDVIFVEPVNTPVEVINLDEEKNSDETASITSSNNSFLNYSPSKSKVSKVHQERRELLGTPDSASNDFIGTGSVELNQSNFNFGLHGKDFDNDKFLKPANPAERCETESSSSTLENNLSNSMKTAVFSEIEFPKEDMFSEANLENFGNLITPNRKRAMKDTVRVSTPVEILPPELEQNVYSSDSSSESDFEGASDKQNDFLKSSKNLPDLSPMNSVRSSLQPAKKGKKSTSFSSKYDLINAVTTEALPKKSKQRKRKTSDKTPKKKSKSKKKKNEDNNSALLEETNDEEPNASKPDDADTPTFDGDENKRKKRRSKKTDVIDNSALIDEFNKEEDIIQPSASKRSDTDTSPIDENETKRKKRKSKKTDVLDKSVPTDEFNKEESTLQPAGSKTSDADTSTVDEDETKRKKRRSKKTDVIDNSVPTVESNKEGNTLHLTASKTSDADTSTVDEDETKRKKRRSKKSDVHDNTVPIEETNNEEKASDAADVDATISDNEGKRKKRKVRNVEVCDKSTLTEDLNIIIQPTAFEPRDTNPVAVDEDVAVSDGETKRKKRKSNEFLDDPLENLDNQLTKKAKINRTKNFSSGELDATDVQQKDFVEAIPNKEIPVESVATEKQIKTEAITSEAITIKIEKDDDQPGDQTEQDQEQKLDVAVKTEGSTQTTEGLATQPLDALVVDVNPIKLEPPLVTNDPIGSEACENTQTDDHQFEGFVVVDEAVPSDDASVVHLSDSESVLSELIGKPDIQLNLEEPESQSKNSVMCPMPCSLIERSVEEVQNTMSNDPTLWTILDVDRSPHRRPAGAGRRCNKCRERGHMAVRCPNKVVPKCNLCGETGHYEPRCPNRICTQCGARSPYSTTYCKVCFRYRNHKCEICLVVGHDAKACPDLWRRYHLTTTEGPLKSHEGPDLKPKNKLWCSGCARSGHLEYACGFFRSVYPPADPSIKSYDDVYPRRGEVQPLVRVDERQFSLSTPTVVNSHVEDRPLLLPAPSVVQNHMEGRSFLLPNPLTIDQYGNAQIYPVFMNNQRNQSTGPVYDRNFCSPSQRQNNQEFYFEDNLPNYISFDTQPPPDNSVPTQGHFKEQVVLKNANQQPPLSNTHFQTQGGHFNEQVVTDHTNQQPSPPDNNYRKVQTKGGCDNIYANQRELKECARVFNSGTTEKIHSFLCMEISKLRKMSYIVESIVSDLKRYIFLEKGQFRKMKKSYKTLNMVLFGIYKFNEGEMHLRTLKHFRNRRLLTRLSQQQRQELSRSYTYIFGVKRHPGVDYHKLLRYL